MSTVGENYLIGTVHMHGVNLARDASGNVSYIAPPIDEFHLPKATKFPPGSEAPRDPEIRRRFYVVYHVPGASEAVVREKLAHAKDVSPRDLYDVLAAEARLEAAPGRDDKDVVAKTLVDGELAEAALKLGHDKKDIAKLLTQMHSDAATIVQEFRAKWRNNLLDLKHRKAHQTSHH